MPTIAALHFGWFWPNPVHRTGASQRPVIVVARNTIARTGLLTARAPNAPEVPYPRRSACLVSAQGGRDKRALHGGWNVGQKLQVTEFLSKGASGGRPRDRQVRRRVSPVTARHQLVWSLLA